MALNLPQVFHKENKGVKMKTLKKLILTIAITTTSVSFAEPQSTQNSSQEARLEKYHQFKMDLGENPEAKVTIKEFISITARESLKRNHPFTSSSFGKSSTMMGEHLDWQTIVKEKGKLHKRWKHKFRSKFHNIPLKLAVRFYRELKSHKATPSESSVDRTRSLPTPNIQNQSQSAPLGSQSSAVK